MSFPYVRVTIFRSTSGEKEAFVKRALYTIGFDKCVFCQGEEQNVDEEAIHAKT